MGRLQWTMAKSSVYVINLLERQGPLAVCSWSEAILVAIGANQPNARMLLANAFTHHQRYNLEILKVHLDEPEKKRGKS